MPKPDRTSAIEFLHMESDAFAAPRKTFICVGVARGGTSAVAGTMHRMGVYMGENLENNYEDQAFTRATLPEMKAVIDRRNATHQVWGWKNPQAANVLEHLLENLVNPHLVVVYRDLVATMKAHMRWHNRSQDFAAHDIMMQWQRNWFLVERWKVPTALVSYEKTILSPDGFLDDMAEFLSHPPLSKTQRKEMKAFLAPGSYK